MRWLRRCGGSRAQSSRPRVFGRDNASWLSSAIFVCLMIGAAYLDGRTALAIYSLSFWHYYLYWLAYFYGAVSPRVFKRDAISMKSASLIALGAVYLAAPLDAASLVVVASGFLLNGVAAAALGSDRTYYGHEVADLPPQQSTAFPYSVMSHPMLVGNIAAFGGTMINADFRQHWWPLACTHVAMNLGLLVMELAVTPRRLGSRRTPIGGGDRVRHNCSLRTACFLIAAGAALGAAVARGAGATDTLLPAGVGGCILAYTYVLYCCYMLPVSSAGQQPTSGGGGS
jgi:hypothetical protein